MTEEAAATNDQVVDAIQQVNDLLRGSRQPFAAGAAYQALSHALSLAMHNAVQQQQHSFTLRCAMTTAAATALLDGRTEQAEAVLKLAESPLMNPGIDVQINALHAVVVSLRDEIEKTLAAVPEAAAEPTTSTA